MKSTISVVAPAYCEGACLHEFVADLATVLDRLQAETRLGYEIILVDDGSTDDTWAAMRRLTEQYPRLRCLRLSRNFGKDAALSAGLAAARGDAVVTMDSDMQHPASLIPEMAALWLSGAADVVDVRKQERQAESVFNRFCALAFYRLFQMLTSYDLKGSGDFKLLDRKVVDAWNNLGERKAFYRGLTSWMGFRHKEIFFTPRARNNGSSKWSLARKTTLAVDSVTSFSGKPLLLIGCITLLFYALSLVVGCEALWSYVTGEAQSGFTTVILLILFTGSAILTGLCILSAYIHHAFVELKGRPRFLLAETAQSDAADF
ncbi:glycosyltransferase family 2 protein [Desulfovibrio legallii]|jgi:dolichol-phosphate mannosyltransferase|uniref:Glycosyltransferase involved in cell wall bisynthesis n=1 Tax=Desulfovibrio legallii TaxID=571438 RepID=A0A1G7PD55_9BACT|nr:glycosyltransferase family 2 protein [Desulfovibrio legallii]SDF84057.1 Glycosyltransferase involved in cell wall bisynthesis [Desulfovibrio legallii]